MELGAEAAVTLHGDNGGGGNNLIIPAVISLTTMAAGAHSVVRGNEEEAPEVEVPNQMDDAEASQLQENIDKHLEAVTADIYAEAAGLMDGNEKEISAMAAGGALAQANNSSWNKTVERVAKNLTTELTKKFATAFGSGSAETLAIKFAIQGAVGMITYTAQAAVSGCRKRRRRLLAEKNAAEKLPVPGGMGQPRARSEAMPRPCRCLAECPPKRRRWIS